MNCDRCGRKMDKPAATVGRYHYGPVCFSKMFGQKEKPQRGKKAVRVDVDQLELELETK